MLTACRADSSFRALAGHPLPQRPVAHVDIEEGDEGAGTRAGT